MPRRVLMHGLKFRRRREGRTDYRARKRMLASGLPRAVVHISLRNISVQIVEYSASGDRTLCSASSHDLRRFGWRYHGDTTPAAYLVGYIAGKRAMSRGAARCVLDIGNRASRRGARVYGVLKGMLDAGMDIPHDPGVLPSESRLLGEHMNADIKDEVVRVKEEIDRAGPEVRPAGTQKR